MSKQTPKTKKIEMEKLEHLTQQLTRVLADYDNLIKRTASEKEELIKYASLRLVTKLLPVTDMLEEAQKHLGDSGLAIALNELLAVFRDEGIVKISVAKGEQFDENRHEAIETVEGKKPDTGTIAEVALDGWEYLDGTVIRHAKVKVVK